MTTTTERQITSGKAESTIDTTEFQQLVAATWQAYSKGGQNYMHKTHTDLVAHIEAVREKDKEMASMYFAERNSARDAVYRYREEVKHLEAERDHFKAIAERQAAELLSYDAMLRRVKDELYRLDTHHDMQTEIEALLSPAQQEPGSTE
jgi:hypothetical protein